MSSTLNTGVHRVDIRVDSSDIRFPGLPRREGAEKGKSVLREFYDE